MVDLTKRTSVRFVLVSLASPQAFDSPVRVSLGSLVMSVLRSGFLERRRAAAIVFALFVAGGIVFVFAGALARATELEQEAARARAEVAALEERLAAGNAEVEFLRSDRFLEQQARVVGYGERGEQPFRLPDGAPSPEPIVPLGDRTEAVVSGAPLEAWLELLFGA
jgi:cell division protein FtsB